MTEIRLARASKLPRVIALRSLERYGVIVLLEYGYIGEILYDVIRLLRSDILP